MEFDEKPTISSNIYFIPILDTHNRKNYTVLFIEYKNNLNGERKKLGEIVYFDKLGYRITPDIFDHIIFKQNMPRYFPSEKNACIWLIYNMKQWKSIDD